MIYDEWGNAITDTKPRCTSCNKLLAEQVTRPWKITCSRCKATNVGADRPMPNVQDVGVSTVST